MDGPLHQTYHGSCNLHWCRLIKNVGRDKPKYWGQRVAITDEGIGVSQLLVAHASAAPKSMPMIICKLLRHR